jgi:diaminopimelate decarboxylase
LSGRRAKKPIHDGSQKNELNGYLDFIDIGGGFFSPMRPELQAQFPFKVPSFEEYGHAIASVFARAYPEQNGPELILEPGISIAANTMQFAAKIIDLKPAGDRLIALAAASQYDIKPTLSPRNLPITVYSSAAENMPAQRQTFDIVGSSCMESDCLYRGYQGELKPGDYVVFDNVGAYTNVLRPPFINPAPPILSYSSKHEVKVIRRRETTDDIFSSYSFTAFEQGAPTA